MQSAYKLVIILFYLMAFVISLIGVLSFITIAIGLVISLMAATKFVGGPLREYLIFTNLTFLFILIPYFIWVSSEITAPTISDAQSVTIISVSVLMIISSGLFMKASISLRDMANTFGFRKKKVKNGSN